MKIFWSRKTETIGLRILLAFFCILILLIIQSAFALYSSNRVVTTQHNAFTRQFTLLTFREKLSELRTKVFAILATHDPSTMDTLKTEIEQTLDDLIAESKALNIPQELLVDSQKTYLEVVELHWNFRTAEAYKVINSTSKEEYDKLCEALETANRNIEMTTQEIVRQSNRQFVVVAISLCGAGLLIVILWGWYLIRSIANPIKQAVRYAQMIADGDLSMAITVHRNDEAGQLLAAFKAMLSRLKSMLTEIETLIQAVQAGNLSVRGKADAFAGGWRDLIQGMNAVVEAFVAPITATAGYIDRIAKGDIPEMINEDYQGDFNATKDNVNTLIAATHDITRLAETLAEGNLLVEVHERSEHDVLMQALNTMIEHVKLAVTNVRDSANTIADMSGQLRSNAEQLSNGAAKQAASMEESSSSMEEMAANIRQNADNAQQTEKIAVQSMKYTEEMERVVAETIAAMQQISRKIAIIQDIANQTRMLSLNATIEAARAQNHGKAFSVVAAEVRQLSDTTKVAAEEIEQLAASSFEVSEKAGTMLATLVPSIRKTTELIMEISAASNEQNAGAEQVNRAIQQADQVTQQNAAIAEETASSAEELANQAQQLQCTIGFFTIEESSQTETSKRKHHKTHRHLEQSKKERRVYEPEMKDSKVEPESDDEYLHVDDDHYDDEFEQY
jgi:methyl-accepting chemotaxis protein